MTRAPFYIEPDSYDLNEKFKNSEKLQLLKYTLNVCQHLCKQLWFKIIQD